MHIRKLFVVLGVVIIFLTGCIRSAPGSSQVWKPGEIIPTIAIENYGVPSPTPSFKLPSTSIPGSPIFTPTPDSIHEIATQRSGPEQYSVQPGDTLSVIAGRYSVSLDELMIANGLMDANNIFVGQVLEIPLASPQVTGNSFKIIPDSELVNGPMSMMLDIASFIQSKGGYLSNYHEEVEGNYLDGAQIINLVSTNYSVNPRLLLAILEYRSGWLTNPRPEPNTLEYPIGIQDYWHVGLYRQLTWSADILNKGYYLWKVNGLNNVVLKDGSVVPLSVTINAGTAAVQFFFSNLDNYSDWLQDISEDGLFGIYNLQFGYPFDYAIEPLIPTDLAQPRMILPFEAGQTWAFTGGPHGGWDSGSAWAALDFAPPGEAQGCVQSEAWVTAVADGLIVRSENGAVVQDLDDDGFEQSGWVVLYMHIDLNRRIASGSYLKTGERIGHPSCEGGVSNGTHVHLARKFNGEWISADGSVPFNLGGWVSSGTGREYDGFLTRGEEIIEAYDGNNVINQIQK